MTVRVATCIALLWFAVASAMAANDKDPATNVTSTDCVAAFKRYKNAFDPIHFALSPDGMTCAYSMCISDCKRGVGPQTVLSLCQHATGGAPCERYAFRGSVISKTGVKPGGAAGN